MINTILFLIVVLAIFFFWEKFKTTTFYENVSERMDKRADKMAERFVEWYIGEETSSGKLFKFFNKLYSFNFIDNVKFLRMYCFLLLNKNYISNNFSQARGFAGRLSNKRFAQILIQLRHADNILIELQKTIEYKSNIFTHWDITNKTYNTLKYARKEMADFYGYTVPAPELKEGPAGKRFRNQLRFDL